MNFLRYMEACKGDPRVYAQCQDRINMAFDAEKGMLELVVEPKLKELLKGSEFFELLEFYLTTRVFGGGPKVFKPTSQQLRLLGEMTLNVPFESYVQPFETMVIEYPDDFSETHIVDITDKVCGCTEQRPLFSILHWRDGCLLHSVYMSGMISLKSWWYPHPTHELEVWLDKQYGDKDLMRMDASDEEVDMETQVRRCALAYALLIDEVGAKKSGPAQPAKVTALRRTIERRPDLADTARATLKCQPMVYELNQQVTLHRTVASHAELGTPTGRTMPPHHRRGFYKMQPHGPANSLRKRVRILPVFVNAHLFLGSMADAKAVYS